MENKKNQCLILVKNRLIAQFRINTFRYETNQKKKRNQILMAAVISLVMIMMLFYVTLLSYGLAKVGVGSLIPEYGFFLCAVITLFFTVFKANGELFAYKDYEMLMSLPIKTTSVITSRFLNLYLWNTAFTLLVMLPMGIIYGIFESPAITFWLLWIPGIFLTCLIPTTIATVIGALITAISSKFRYSNLVCSILSIILVLIFIVASMGMGGDKNGLFMENGTINEANFSELTTTLSSVMEKAYPPAGLYQSGIVEGRIEAFLLFLVISVGWYALFTGILSKYYKSINTAVSTFYSKSDYKIKSLNQSSILSALYHKEWKRWISSTVYMTNTIVGALLAVVASISIYVMGVDQVGAYLKINGLQDIILVAAPFFICAMIGMCSTTSSALSLEGKNLWILQSLPVLSSTVYDSKILVNLTLSVPCSLVCSVFLCLTVRPGIIGGMLYFLLPLVYSVLSAVWGMWVNILFPNYEWENETQVVKQGISTLLGLFPGMILAIMMGVISSIIPFDYRFSLFLFVVVSGIFAAGIYNRIRKQILKS